VGQGCLSYLLFNFIHSAIRCENVNHARIIRSINRRVMSITRDKEGRDTVHKWRQLYLLDRRNERLNIRRMTLEEVGSIVVMGYEVTLAHAAGRN